MEMKLNFYILWVAGISHKECIAVPDNKVKTLGVNTRCIHAGFSTDPATGAASVPVYQSAGFAYDTANDLANVFTGKKYGHIYSRISNPTLIMLEQRLAKIDQGIGSVVTATGLAAISGVIFALCQSGDHIVASQSLFGGTLDLFDDTLAKLGIQTTFVDVTDPRTVESAINDRTQLIFVEVISNPRLDIPDLKLLSHLAHQNDIPLIADTTLTPCHVLDASLAGVDVAVYSGTKYVSGNGGILSGVVTDFGKFNWAGSRSEDVKNSAQKFGKMALLERVRWHVLHNIGATLTPNSAYVMMQGVETMGVRIARQCQNAYELAQFFESHPLVSQVNYPGLAAHPQYSLAAEQFNDMFGGLLTISLSTKADCFNCIDRLNIVKNMANLGDIRTMIIHPESTIYARRPREHQEAAGVTPELLRISVGLEDIEDIKEDFDQALKGVG